MLLLGIVEMLIMYSLVIRDLQVLVTIEERHLLGSLLEQQPWGG